VPEMLEQILALTAQAQHRREIQGHDRHCVYLKISNIDILLNSNILVIYYYHSYIIKILIYTNNIIVLIKDI
jgi:hypothetical protein